MPRNMPPVGCCAKASKGCMKCFCWPGSTHSGWLSGFCFVFQKFHSGNDTVYLAVLYIQYNTTKGSRHMSGSGNGTALHMLGHVEKMTLPPSLLYASGTKAVGCTRVRSQ